MTFAANCDTFALAAHEYAVAVRRRTPHHHGSAIFPSLADCEDKGRFNPNRGFLKSVTVACVSPIQGLWKGE
jgi:hypothetical protein